jgi:NADH:ubiquinone oxidoreductase subunit 4 (subunit M)
MVYGRFGIGYHMGVDGISMFFVLILSRFPDAASAFLPQAGKVD